MSSNRYNSGYTAPATDSVKGVGFMVTSMLLIPIVDGIAKFLSAEFSPLFISWSQYAATCALILPIAIHRYRWGVLSVQNLPAQIMRTLFLVATVTLYHLAISKVPLTLALSAYFVGPLITVMLSIMFLGERLTSIKLLALGLGFVGSLVILKPDGALNAGVLHAFGAGFFFALYLTMTRLTAANNDPFKTLVFQFTFGTIVLFPQATLAWSTPGLEDLIFFLCLGLFAAAAYMLSIIAFRHAEASVLAPLIYVELIGSCIVGFLVFNEIPDMKTILGAGFIVVSGMLILVERR